MLCSPTIAYFAAIGKTFLRNNCKLRQLNRSYRNFHTTTPTKHPTPDLGLTVRHLSRTINTAPQKNKIKMYIKLVYKNVPKLRKAEFYRVKNNKNVYLCKQLFFLLRWVRKPQRELCGIKVRIYIF